MKYMYANVLYNYIFLEKMSHILVMQIYKHAYS